MGSCYSGDNSAGQHNFIHTDITTGNIGEPQQKYHLATLVLKRIHYLHKSQTKLGIPSQHKRYRSYNQRPRC